MRKGEVVQALERRLESAVGFAERISQDNPAALVEACRRAAIELEVLTALAADLGLSVSGSYSDRIVSVRKAS